ncbi:hypothetical protein X975_21724, partial [Stegodyphus mimosarum]
MFFSFKASTTLLISHIVLNISSFGQSCANSFFNSVVVFLDSDILSGFQKKAKYKFFTLLQYFVGYPLFFKSACRHLGID